METYVVLSIVKQGEQREGGKMGDFDERSAGERKMLNLRSTAIFVSINKNMHLIKKCIFATLLQKNN